MDTRILVMDGIDGEAERAPLLPNGADEENLKEMTPTGPRRLHATRYQVSSPSDS